MMTDDALLEAFERCAIPRQSWNHQAHVRVAWLHLRRAPFAQAVRELGTGIRKLNAVLGVLEGPTMGYHETLTCLHVRDMGHHAVERPR